MISFKQRFFFYALTIILPRRAAFLPVSFLNVNWLVLLSEFCSLPGSVVFPEVDIEQSLRLHVYCCIFSLFVDYFFIYFAMGCGARNCIRHDKNNLSIGRDATNHPAKV